MPHQLQPYKTVADAASFYAYITICDLHSHMFDTGDQKPWFDIA